IGIAGRIRLRLAVARRRVGIDRRPALIARRRSGNIIRLAARIVAGRLLLGLLGIAWIVGALARIGVGPPISAPVARIAGIARVLRIARILRHPRILRVAGVLSVTR